jgi:hypothetical protein
MVNITPRPHFTPGKEPVPIVQEAGWAPEPVWKGGKSRRPPGFDPRTVQPIVSLSFYILLLISLLRPDNPLICLFKLLKKINIVNSSFRKY